MRVDRLEVELAGNQEDDYLDGDKRVPRARRLAAWNRPLMASTKPLV
jgi:hypothetical protein